MEAHNVTFKGHFLNVTAVCGKNMMWEHSDVFPLENLLFNVLRDQSVAKTIQNDILKVEGKRIQIRDSPKKKKKKEKYNHKGSFTSTELCTKEIPIITFKANSCNSQLPT